MLDIDRQNGDFLAEVVLEDSSVGTKVRNIFMCGFLVLVNAGL